MHELSDYDSLGARLRELDRAAAGLRVEWRDVERVHRSLWNLRQCLHAVLLDVEIAQGEQTPRAKDRPGR